MDVNNMTREQLLDELIRLNLKYPKETNPSITCKEMSEMADKMRSIIDKLKQMNSCQTPKGGKRKSRRSRKTRKTRKQKRSNRN